MEFFNRWSPKFFIRISPDTVEVHRNKSSVVWRDDAVIALSDGPKNKVLGIGAAARMAVSQNSGATLYWPFRHPRCLISDWLIAEVLLKSVLKEQIGKSWFALAPEITVHLCPAETQSIGGLTTVEYRAWSEALQHCGAKSVEFLRPMDFSDAQIQLLLNDPAQLEASIANNPSGR